MYWPSPAANLILGCKIGLKLKVAGLGGGLIDLNPGIPTAYGRFGSGIRYSTLPAFMIFFYSYLL